MKKALVLLMAVVVLAAAGTYFYFSGKEYVYQISEHELQQKLDEKLPLTGVYYFLIEVTLDHPRVGLMEGSDRIKAGLDIVLNIKLGSQAQPMGGSIDVTSGIRYAADQGQFFLADPVIEQLTIQGIPDAYTQQVSTAVTKAITEYYADHPVYALNAGDAGQAAARLVLKKVVVENKKLVITLGL